jgi:glycosyltransferase involved in cell wall biosynthesis
LATHWVSTNCDALVACSRWDAAEQQQQTDLPVHVVLNGIDTGMFAPARTTGGAGPPVVAWIGRGWDLKQKRLDVLASIAPLLHKAGVRLRVADPGGPARAAPGIAEVLSPLVEFWGPVPRPGMAPFFQEIAASGGCVLSTSAFEGLPLALLEAQACGCPVIGPDVRGVNECVSPEHGGLLYPFGLEPDRLAGLVLAALADGATMDERRKECARYVHERFGEYRMADTYLRIYEEAPDPPCGRAPATRSVRDYVDRYWTPGYCLHVASQRLAEAGDWRLAARTARAAMSKCPTLFLRTRRIRHLLRTHKNWLVGCSRVREDDPLD